MVADRQTAAVAPAVPAGGVEISNVTKRFGNFLALDRLSLQLPPGEFLALLGPSGSGKSTLLNLIAGFERPDAGRIVIAGRDVVRLPPERRGVGIVFQSYALFPHLNVGENLAYPLRRRGIARAERQRRISDALDLVRLSGTAERAISRLSGGQQQRVALARALITRPDILLLDEPLAALDKALRDELQVELKQLQRRVSTTVIMVTHDQHEALALADRIGVLNHGRLQQEGPAREVFERPATSFVARFLGGATVLRGVLDVSDAGVAIRLADGKPLPGRWCGDRPPIAGQPAELAVRPDMVAVRPGADGVVTANVYGGDMVLVHVTLHDGSRLVARLRSAACPAEGDAIAVSWQADQATIFPCTEEIR
jgi:ABC-type Fe3+/spermidine/putrescine transport system ATPase subunit